MATVGLRNVGKQFGAVLVLEDIDQSRERVLTTEPDCRKRQRFNDENPADHSAIRRGRIIQGRRSADGQATSFSVAQCSKRRLRSGRTAEDSNVHQRPISRAQYRPHTGKLAAPSEHDMPRKTISNMSRVGTRKSGTRS